MNEMTMNMMKSYSGCGEFFPNKINYKTKNPGETGDLSP